MYNNDMPASVSYELPHDLVHTQMRRTPLADYFWTLGSGRPRV